MEEKETKKKSIFSLKNIFIFLIAISFAKSIFHDISKQIKEAVYPNTHIGYITVQGAIYDSSHYTKQISKFLKKDDIKGLILKINSPGGTPGAAQAIFNELKKFKSKKPIIALIEDLGASGAYYVSAAADKIISVQSSLVGSIGVLMQLPNIKALLNNNNINVDVMQAGKFKTATSMLKDKTPEEIVYLNDIIKNSYDQFVKDIAEARKLDIKKSNVWANGRIFTGNQALKLGLVDQHGSISDAKETMKELLIERNVEIVGKIKLIKPKRLQGLAKLLYDEPDNNEQSYSTKIASLISSVYNQIISNQAIETLRV